MTFRAYALALTLGLILSPVCATEVAIQELRMYGCEMHYAVIPVPVDEAEAYLPKGYLVKPWLNNPLFPLGNFFVLGQRCDTVTLDDGTVVVDYHDVLHGILVSPPPEHASPGIHSVLTGILTSAPTVASVYEAWGLTAEADGDVTIETLPDDEPDFIGPLLVGGPVGFSYGESRAFSLAIEIAATAATAPFAGTPFRLHVPNANGDVAHYAHYDIKPGRVQIGAATAAFPHGSPFTTSADAGVAGIYTWTRDELAQTLGLVEGSPTPPSA